jgi:hypothetical protein
VDYVAALCVAEGGGKGVDVIERKKEEQNGLGGGTDWNPSCWM